MRTASEATWPRCRTFKGLKFLQAARHVEPGPGGVVSPLRATGRGLTRSIMTHRGVHSESLANGGGEPCASS